MNQPVVIAGCPRSGTTLLRRLFDAHGAFSCPGESFVLRGAARFLAGERVAEGIDYGPLGGLAALGFSHAEIKARVRDMALSFHADIAKAEGKPRFALKTAVDAFYLPQIHELLAGEAKFVCLIRHGADVAVSLRDFCDAMEGVIEELMPFVNAHHRLLPACAQAWATVTADMLALAEAHPGEVFAFRYEDLIDDPHAVLAALFEFVDAPCDVAALVNEAFRAKPVRGLGDYKTFATGGIHGSSRGRWKELPERVKAELAPILNPVLVRAGYEAIDCASAKLDGMRLHELAMMFKAQAPAGAKADG